MKASAFAYVRAGDMGEALALLERHGASAKVLAGGQSLLPALNLRLSAPELLIDISRIRALRGITVTADRLRIGALARHAEVMASPEVIRHAPLLARALAHVAHPAIRNRGTFGGSLANADPAAELPACVLALDAVIVAESSRGTRRIQAGAFFTGLFETALAADEILTAVEIPLTPEVCGFAELARRSGDYAIVGLAAQGLRAGSGFTSLRLAWFSVGSTAILSPRAAAALVAGQGVAQACQALAQDLEPHDDLQASGATRLRLAQVLLKRVVGEMLS